MKDKLLMAEALEFWHNRATARYRSKLNAPDNQLFKCCKLARNRLLKHHNLLNGMLAVIVGIMLRHHSLLRSDTGRTIVLLPNFI